MIGNEQRPGTPQQVHDELHVEAPIRHIVLPVQYLGELEVSATPSVLNVNHWKTKATAPITITDFDKGQNGQTIFVKGDGFTTVSHNANIKTNVEMAKLLTAGRVYQFTAIFDDVLNKNIWYENTGGGSGGGSSVPGSGDITINGTAPIVVTWVGQTATISVNQSTITVTWANVQGKPTEFAPAPHALNNTTTHTGLLDFAQLPTGSGTWSLGASETSVLSLPHRFMLGSNTYASTLMFRLNTAASVNREVRFETNGIVLWIFRVAGTETGVGNTGGNWQFLARNDAGGAIGTALEFTHADMTATFAGNVIVARTTGSATGAITPALIQLKSNTTSGTWGIAVGDAWAAIDAFSSDSSGIGVGVRARIGFRFNDAAGTLTNIIFRTSDASTLHDAFAIMYNNVLYIARATAVPVVNPVGGVFFYVDAADNVFIRKPSGVIVPIA